MRGAEIGPQPRDKVVANLAKQDISAMLMHRNANAGMLGKKGSRVLGKAREKHIMGDAEGRFLLRPVSPFWFVGNLLLAPGIFFRRNYIFALKFQGWVPFLCGKVFQT